MGSKQINVPAIEIKQERRKVLPFTVTTIGGAAELARWKADQARQEDEWRAGAPARYAKAQERAVSVLMGERPRDQAIVQLDIAENSLRDCLTQQALRYDAPEPKAHVEEPKLPFFRRVTDAAKNWWVGLWKSAFRNERH